MLSCWLLSTCKIGTWSDLTRPNQQLVCHQSMDLDTAAQLVMTNRVKDEVVALYKTTLLHFGKQFRQLELALFSGMFNEFDNHVKKTNQQSEQFVTFLICTLKKHSLTSATSSNAALFSAKVSVLLEIRMMTTWHQRPLWFFIAESIPSAEHCLPIGVMNACHHDNQVTCKPFHKCHQ
jgi:hypothetical protein